MSQENVNQEEVTAASEENPTSPTDMPLEESAKWQSEAADWKDKYVRLYAEFENFRKRTQKEKSDLILTANEELIRNLLPVVDDFDRAFKNIPQEDSTKALREGVELIYQKYLRTLQQKGLKEMEALGVPFNPELHEAITQLPSPTEDMKGKVMDVLEKGYLLGDKVIRYAKVVIGA